MLTPRFMVAGLASMVAASMALADFDGPAPLSWRWIQPTSATVKGSPIIDGNSVYVAVGQRAFALDKSTGNQKWRFPLVDPIDGYFVGAPVNVNGTLILTADNHKIYAVDAETGQQKWSYLSRPAFVGSAVRAGKYIAVARNDQSIMALDAETGAPIWVDSESNEERPVKMLYGITGQITAAGDNVLITDNNNELISLNLVTKKADWTANFTTLDYTAQPTVVGDLIVINSGQFLTGVRAATGRGAWQIPIGYSSKVGPAVSGHGIFVVDENGKGTYYDMNGRIASRNTVDLGSFPLARPAVAGNLFVVPTTNGAINLVDPMSGQVTWSYLIRPLGVFYTESSGSSSQTNTPTGGGNAKDNPPDRIWTVQAAGTPVVSGDTLLVLAKDGSLLAFDKNTGVDLTPPAVTMSWPRPGDQVNGESLEVLFKIEDEASGINDPTLKITVDGAPLDVQFGREGIASARFSLASKNKPLTNGRKVFHVTVADWKGNKAEKDFVLTIDNMLPKTVRPVTPNNSGGGRPGGLGGPGGPGGRGGRGGLGG